MRQRKYSLILLVSICVFIFVTLFIIHFAEEWSIPYKEKQLNIKLNSTCIIDIDNQLRNTYILKKKKEVYLNSIVLKTEVNAREVMYENLEIVYAYKFNHTDGNEKYKIYSYIIDLNDKIIKSVSQTGNDQLGGYNSDLELNNNYITFDDYIETILENDKASVYVNSGERFYLNLIFNHYDQPYHAVVSSGKNPTRIDME